MAHYQTTIDSSRSAQEAFDYMAAFENVNEWDPTIVEAQRLDAGEVRVGTRFKVVVSNFGRQIPLEYRVEEIDPGRRLLLIAETSTLRSVDEITVAARGAGSAVTYDAKVDLRGVLALFNPLWGLMFGRYGDRARDGLRKALAG